MNKVTQKKLVLQNNRQNYIIILFSLITTIFFFGASNVYFQNMYEFNMLYVEFMPLILLVTFTLTTVSAVLLFLIKNSETIKKVISILTAVVLLIWVQGNFLNWNFGVFDGKKIYWSEYLLPAIIELAIWVTLVIFALVRYKWLYAVAQRIAIAIFIMQLVALTLLVTRPYIGPWWLEYNLQSQQQFTFSKKTNVIILIVDTFQSTVFEEITTKEPSLTKPLDGFTYFRNTTGSFPYTQPSVPVVLTGLPYDNSVPFTTYTKKIFYANSLPKIFKDNGYIVDMYPMVPMSVYLDGNVASNITLRKKDILAISPGKIVNSSKIFDVVLFKHFPIPLKYLIYNQGHWRVEPAVVGVLAISSQEKINKDLKFIENMKKTTKVVHDQGAFKFYHLNGVHSPLTLNENLEYEEMDESRMNHKRQSIASLKIIGQFLNKLKDMEIYDDSLIIITADHGYGPIGINNPRINQMITDPNYYARGEYEGGALPLLLIKPLKERGKLKTSDVQASLTDIPITILEEIGLKGDKYVNGVNVFSLTDKDNRQRKYYLYKWKWLRTNDFLPPLKEYIISGDSWVKGSWSQSSKILTPQNMF